jgi:adenylate cyclase, class 2
LVMAHLNVEIKATCHNPEFLRNYFALNNAFFKGRDLQTDTYFHVPRGRLKLREGNIENNLIYYERDDQPGAKESNFRLVPVPAESGIKELLSASLGIKVVIKKQRDIFFIENVKFHIDEVAGLGSFMEIEASDLYAKRPKEELQRQCAFYMQEFGIRDEDLVGVSYSDLLLGPGK